MNSHCRRAQQTLEALGFTRDTDASKYGKSVWFHANDPDVRLKTWGGMAEMAARAVVDKARHVAGLSSVGPVSHAQVREVTRLRKVARSAREKAAADRLERERAAMQAVVDAKAAEVAATQRAEARRREMADLMQPGRGR